MNTPTNQKILLINPSYDRGSALGPFARYITSQLPLSLGFLAGYLLSRNIAVVIRDEQLQQVGTADLASLIELQGVRIVGITVLTLTAPRAYDLGAFIKARWPQVTVVMGGVHVSVLPDEPLEKGVADIVVRGEGEHTLEELVRTVGQGAPYEDIPGISYRRGEGNRHNPSRPPVEDLDALPSFPYELFEQEIGRYQFGNILASRGCPYDCIFCSQRAVSGRSYRAHSPQRIFAELERLVFRYGQRFVFINDDNFLVQKSKVRELCDLIIRRGFPVDVRIGFNGRGDSLDASLLRHMRRAHFAYVLVGFETGSERLMTLIKKGETVSQIADGVRAAKEAGFTVGGQFILGFPGETRRESLQTLCHALRLPIDFVRFNLLVPYPGTEVREIILREQAAPVTDWARFATHGGLTGSGAPYVPQGRSSRELVLLQWLGHLLFYLRPRTLRNLRNMQYATGGQLVMPDPTTLKGFGGLLVFAWRLLCSFAGRVLRRRAPER